MSFSPTTPCPLCQGDAFRCVVSITEPDRFELAAGVSPKGYARRWMECQGCGLLVNVIDRAALSSIYATDYYSSSIEGETPTQRYERIMALPPGASDNALRVARIRAALGELDAVRPGQVLDIGAGTGVFLARFLADAQGWQGTALEPNPDACAHLRSLGRFEVLEGSFPETTTRRYDLVTLNKVLEHLADPLGVLEKTESALAPDGLVYVEVPDKLTAVLRPATDNILGSLHHYLFDPATLARLLDLAGFSTLWLRRYVEPSGKITVSALAMTAARFAARAGDRA